MAGFAKRLDYERELIHVIEAKRDDFFGQRGTHSQGIDVLFFKPSGIQDYSFCIRGEVKTSNSHKIQFSQKLLEQYNKYMKLWSERRIKTFYFFRLLTSKQQYQYKDNSKELRVKIFRAGRKEDKWHAISIDKLPLNRNGRPFLNFFDENALSIEDFLEIFP